MIPITKLKEKLENHVQRTSDKEIEQIRDIQEQLADVIFSMWIEHKLGRNRRNRKEQVGKKAIMKILPLCYNNKLGDHLN